MKLYMLRIFLVGWIAAMASCSGEDDTNLYESAENLSRPTPSQPVQGLRIQKITQVTYYSSSPPDMEETNFFYNRNRLDSIRSVTGFHVYTSQYHYNGLKINAIENFEDGQPDGTTTIHYIGGFVDYSQTGTNSRTNYTYSGGRVRTIKSYSLSGSTPSLIESRTLTYSGNNIGEELRETFFSGSYLSRSVFTYDSANNPTMGMNKYLRMLIRGEGFNGLSDNNPLVRSSFSPITAPTSVNQYYVMQYNSRNYPLNFKRFSAGSDFLISDTTIEYQ